MATDYICREEGEVVIRVGYYPYGIGIYPICTYKLLNIVTSITRISSPKTGQADKQLARLFKHM